MHKLLHRFFTKFGGYVAHGPRKKPLAFSGNPDLDLDPRILYIKKFITRQHAISAIST